MLDSQVSLDGPGVIPDTRRQVELLEISEDIKNWCGHPPSSLVEETSPPKQAS